EDLFPSMGEISWIGLGVIGTVGTLAAALPSPYFGWLADRYRRGVMMAGSLLVALLGSLMIGLWGNSFLVVFFGFILMGVGLALYHPPGLSWVSSAFEDPNTKSYSKNYVKILALHGIGGSLGASLGPLSVYFLIDVIDSWQQIYLIWSIPLTVVMVGFWVLIGSKEPKNSNQPTLKLETESNSNDSRLNSQNNHTILYFIFFFIITMSLTRGMINFILSPFLSNTKDVVIATAALFIGISTLIGSTGQVLGGIIGDKYGESALLSTTALIQALILGVIFFSDSIPVLFLFYILLGIMNALFWPSTNSLVAKNSKNRGSAFGYVMLIANLIGAVGPVIDGFLLVTDPNQYSLIFIFSISFSLLAFISLVVLEFKLEFKKRKSKTN
ncbi:unnamed protein product, partial [marine sediment metagenome]